VSEKRQAVLVGSEERECDFGLVSGVPRRGRLDVEVVTIFCVLRVICRWSGSAASRFSGVPDPVKVVGGGLTDAAQWLVSIVEITLEAVDHSRSYDSIGGHFARLVCNFYVINGNVTGVP